MRDFCGWLRLSGKTAQENCNTAATLVIGMPGLVRRSAVAAKYQGGRSFSAPSR